MGLVTMSPAVRRLGRLCRCSLQYVGEGLRYRDRFRPKRYACLVWGDHDRRCGQGDDFHQGLGVGQQQCAGDTVARDLSISHPAVNPNIADQ